MEVGEQVAIEQFLNDDLHSESTCPWHKEGKKKAKKMDPVDPDDDSSAMAPNDGGTLGRNMTGDGNKPPNITKIKLKFKEGDEFTFKQAGERKTVQSYVKASREQSYDLQYAPHHLIPGNESLKGSKVVSFLGDEDTISEFAGGQPSHIKEGYSAGYEVNDAANGVWLPSPYALSMANAWPSKPGIKVIKQRRGLNLGDTTEDFKHAYVAASIEETDRQFHMRHKEYSTEVQNILNAIGSRLKKMITGECPIATNSKQNKKFDPPPGLVARLNVLSGNLDRLLTGKLWQPPMYTDDLTKQYAEDLKEIKAKAALTKVL